MNIEEMKLEDIQARKAEIVARRDAMNAELETAEDAALDALKEEAEQLNEEERQLVEREAAIYQAAEQRQKEIEEVLRSGAEKITFEKEKDMSNMEVRNSAEYINAFAKYIRTGEDKECRSLLTENATGGTLPVPKFVGDIIAEAFKESEILRRVRKTYAGGDFAQPFEYSAPIAEAHAEGSGEQEEEELLVGYVTLKAQTWKKWVSVSDEALDLMTGEALLRYLYSEIARGIVKAREKAVCDAILAAPQTATATAPSVAKTGSAAGTIHDIVDAYALLGEGPENIVVIVSKTDYATYKGLQMAANYGVDPFDGLEVIKCNFATVPIVGDLNGVIENFPRGDEEITLKLDDKSRMKEDIVEILGRMPTAIEVVGDKYFAKVSA